MEVGGEESAGYLANEQSVPMFFLLVKFAFYFILILKCFFFFERIKIPLFIDTLSNSSASCF